MDKKELYTLGLKFKRHNLNFDYDEKSKTLTIGKNQKLTRKYLTGGIIIIISLFLIGLINHIELPFAKLIKWVLIISSGFGFTLIGKAWKLSKNNRFKKVFSHDSIKLVSIEETKEFTKNDLNIIEFQIMNLGNPVIGKMVVSLKDNSKIDLLTLMEKNRKHLRADFDYLTRILNNLIGLKKV